MKKNDIVREYKNFLKHYPKITPNQFVLGAGGACLMHGLRTETDDMDMGLYVPLYEHIKNSGKYDSHAFNGTTVVEWSASIDLHPLTDGATVIIDGVCCYSAERLLEQKLSLNRPKDQEDIRKLKILIGR